MKIFEVQIKSPADNNKGTIRPFNSARGQRPLKPAPGDSFMSLPAALNILTEKRIELLRTIRKKHPKSIYALAKLTGRNFRNVYDDVQTLKYYGLLQIRKTGKAKKGKSGKSKRSGQSFSVPYQAINIHAGI